ncbi:hypothetical protein KM043_002585 [Ampulex compressa]|uniref:Venom protein n=1 Tax=Ampulex compressa TaxID=860918 RepID=A0A1W6EVQ7_AMPCP|nr:venom protein [Ampulex compressa]KAG7213286.1 hypothetical protein KM043_002585 [Ampulex compressa]
MKVIMILLCAAILAIIAGISIVDGKLIHVNKRNRNPKIMPSKPLRRQQVRRQRNFNWSQQEYSVNKEKML